MERGPFAAGADFSSHFDLDTIFIGKLTLKFQAAGMNKISWCIRASVKSGEEEKLETRSTARTLLITISSTRPGQIYNFLYYLEREAFVICNVSWLDY